MAITGTRSRTGTQKTQVFICTDLAGRPWRTQGQIVMSIGHLHKLGRPLISPMPWTTDHSIKPTREVNRMAPLPIANLCAQELLGKVAGPFPQKGYKTRDELSCPYSPKNDQPNAPHNDAGQTNDDVNLPPSAPPPIHCAHSRFDVRR